MPRIDLPTLLVVSTVLFALMATMFAVTWAQDKAQHRPMGTWAIAHGLAGPACLLLAGRGQIPGWASIVLANALILGAYGLLWVGARQFSGRPVSVAWAFVGTAIWCLASATPLFWDSFPIRLAIAATVITTYVAVSAAEIARNHADEPLPSRKMVVVVLATLALAHAARIILAVEAPPADVIGTLGTRWTAIVGIQILVQSVVAGYALMALVKERDEFRQRRTAEADSLTGVLTRRAFLGRAADRLAADPTCGAVAIFDLDRFKAINDGHGHLAGDRVLRAFAEVAERRIGADDVFGRLGGEEFALFMPHADVIAAWQIAEAIRRDFAALPIAHDERTLKATVSVGIAAVPMIEPDLDRLIASADAGLYAAKQAGRDRVETADGPDRARLVAGA